MKSSIKFKLFAWMTLLIVFFVLLSLIFNLFFLKKYYNYSKKQSILNSYKSVLHIFKEKAQSDYSLELEKIENNYGVNIVILDKDSNTLYNSRARQFSERFHENIGPQKNRGFFENRNMIDAFIQSRLKDIEKGKPLIEIRKDKRLNTEFISLISTLKDVGFIFVGVPVTSIQESVQISNDFFAITGLVTILIGSFMVFIFSGKFTKPIHELSDIAQSVSVLDFSRKYLGDSNDEIGHLGKSINSMSDQLKISILELKEANEQLKMDIARKEKIDEMRKEFISSISHELKTPISLISGYAEGLKENVITDESNKNYYCEVIIDESSKMNKMVTGLLELAQLESGEFNIEKSSFNINELAESLVKKNSIRFKDRNIIVEIEATKNFEVYADYDKIEQVLSNYLNNAINHIDERKIIKISISNIEKIVRVGVFNFGLPIPEDSLDKVWQSFYKVDKARTRTYGGTGLGLSVVRAILDAHMANYGVSNVEDGVLFWFEL